MSILAYANQNVWELVAYKPGKPIEETARELGMAPEDIVKLASNENSLGPSPRAQEAMQKAVAGVHIYPDGASFSLRSRLAADYGVSFEQTAVGNGSSELIELLGHAFLKPGTEVVAAEYSFAMYSIVAKLFGAEYVAVPNKPDWTHDLQGMLHAITPQTRLVFITNPTNPVGTMVGQEEVDAFMAAVPEHVTVVFDEAYMEFAAEQVDTAKYVRAGRNVAVLRTFSKAYGLAGVRVGYAITSAEIAGLINKARSPFNVNLIAQVGALAALDDTEHLRRSVEMVNAGRSRYYAAFDALGVEYVPCHTNFILVRVGNGARVYADALARGVITRPMGGYGLPEYIRITIGNESENEKCLAVLRELLPPC
ncbi:MAG: histidinol-phosphate transaminase [Akkermansia sp.]|nr:histidinol-phosphate transaminase [Akkermansia sp.]